MNVSNVIMSSYWGREVRHKFITQGSKTLAVIFPGKNYSSDRSLLDYAAKAAREHNCDVLLLEYGYQSARVDFKRDEMSILIQECRTAITSLPEYKKFLFIGKSVGAVIAGKIADELEIQKKTSHLFITPIPDAIPLIQQSKGSVIYGGSDPLFSEEHSRDISGLKHIKVYRIDDANHNLEVGRVNESLAILLVIINFYHEFFNDALNT